MPEEKCEKTAELVAKCLNKELDKKDTRRVSTALFLSLGELKDIAEKLVESEVQIDAKIVSKVLKMERRHDAADIALFGRMVASEPSLTLEGAGMFSHALSTHKVSIEVDFFAAVDEDPPPDVVGAAFTDSLEYNSACYYRYIALNLDLLRDKKHLEHFSDEEYKTVVEAFIHASILAVPSARKNSCNSSRATWRNTSNDRHRRQPHAGLHTRTPQTMVH